MSTVVDPLCDKGSYTHFGIGRDYILLIIQVMIIGYLSQMSN